MPPAVVCTLQLLSVSHWNSQIKFHGYFCHILINSISVCTHACANNIRWPICDGEFFPTFSIFCKYTSKFTCHLIFSIPERRILSVRCRKSDTCEQPNINEKKGKSRCRKSAVGCRMPHTCVHTLMLYIIPTVAKIQTQDPYLVKPVKDKV